MTIATADEIRNGQLVWIDHRNDPGGPARYLVDHGLTWFSILGSAADVVANVMGDALLVSMLQLVLDSPV